MNKKDYLIKSVLNIAPIGFWEWDLVTGKVNLSDETMVLVGLDENKFDHSIQYITENVIKKNCQEKFKEHIAIALSTGIVPQREYEINSKHEKWIRIDGIIIPNEAGELVYMYGTMLDISEHKKSVTLMVNNNSFFEALMKIIPNPIFYKDYKGIYTYCNKAFSQYLGISAETLIGSSVYDIAPKELAEVYHKADQDLMNSKGIQVYEAKVKYADGSNHDVMFSKSANVDVNGNSIGLVGTMYDITERKKNEDLVRKQNLIKDVVILISQKISTFNSESEMDDFLLEKLIEVFEPADYGTIMDVVDDDLLVQSSYNYHKNLISDFTIPLTSSYVYKHNHGNIKLPSVVNDIDKLLDDKGIPAFLAIDQKIHIKSILSIPVIINNVLKKIIFLDSTASETFTEVDLSIAIYLQEQIPIVHKLFTLNQQTINLSRFDSLTGLMNRRYFEDTFEDRLEIAKRESFDVSVILFDLDSLKYVNDMYGHSEGDHYIVAFSKLLKDSFRVTDHFARVGGDEFCGIFIDSNLNVLIEKLESVRALYGKISFGGEASGFIGRFSYGVATYPVDGESGTKLMAIADRRMYLDKLNYKEKINVD